MFEARIAAAPGLRPPPPLAPGWQLLLAALAALAIALPALIVARAPRIQHVPAALMAPRRVVPKNELPAVEPVEVAALSPDEARSYNASIPFSTAPNPAARPFHLFGSAQDQARALDCLAAAEVYEAGDDTVGERAVAQVVLNRVRHPAFPKSICEVVFQGSERSTGCQFTFSCDGALTRWTPRPEAWDRARDVARLALGGAVYRPVGHATHYHTDWVVPYWSASLDKITAVGAHLFFRWAGWWGTPPAFDRAYTGSEPTIDKLAALSEAHRPADGLAAEAQVSLAASLDAVQALGETQIPRAAEGDANTFLVALDPKMAPDAYVALAVRTCGQRPYCKFMGWTNPRAKPEALPLNAAAMASMSFSYLRDEQQQFAKALWNCEQFTRTSPLQCMRSALIGRLDDAPRTETFQLKDLKPRAPPAEPKLQDLQPRVVPPPGERTSQANVAPATAANATGAAVDTR
jgi:spore germination cell wall hydrolase CwlJ-like protein